MSELEEATKELLRLKQWLIDQDVPVNANAIDTAINAFKTALSTERKEIRDLALSEFERYHVMSTMHNEWDLSSCCAWKNASSAFLSLAEKIRGRELAAAKKEIVIHDYTMLRWGWSYNFIAGGKDWFSAVGWGEGLKAGDQIAILLRKTVRVRYWIKEINYKSDPTDMWNATFERVDDSDNPQEPE